MLTRRQFVTGVASLSAAPCFSYGTLKRERRHVSLQIGRQRVNFTGKDRWATTVNNSLPAPTLRWREGDQVTIDVHNQLDAMSSIHWHGIILPSDMDGVPGLSFPGIAPGGSYRYQFNLNQSGTYWYHSHSGFQEQTGLYGALVIEPADTDPFQADRDHVVVLSDWSDESPKRIFDNLRKNSHFYNRQRRNLTELIYDWRTKGIRDTFVERQMWNEMRMLDSDISDVTGFTYTYLMNGITPGDGWRGLFKKGERVRLRFINAGAMTFFDLRIPGLKMRVVSSDGQNIHPVSVDDLRIGPAETYDVIVEPDEDRAYAVFAQAIDRSGYALGHLTPDVNLTADIPDLDPVPRLTHVDMGMGRHGQHESGSDEEHMHHGAHHGHHAVNRGPTHAARPITHKDTEYGPQVDMRATEPLYRLNDPGLGLRDHAARGRKVLTYADMTRLEPVEARDPDRELELHLTGNMERYLWSFDGVPYEEAEPIYWQLGERVRVVLVNDTMMNHPIHLHGLWSELETGADYLPRKHTVVVQPGARISYQVDANAPGRWAYHCHMLYHMMGMFREVRVA